MPSSKMFSLCLAATTVLACADTEPTESSATSSGSTTASASSGETTMTGTPTTGSSATGTSTSDGSDSATGDQTSGTAGTSTGGQTSGTAGTSTGGDTSTGTSEGSGETGVAPSCEGAGPSNLEGVCIVFPPQPDSFTLAEAKAGVEFKYEVVVLADVPGVTTESVNTCDEPGPSGLFVGERVEGGDQAYCLCDQGKCPKPALPAFVLAAGAYPDSLPWDGVNWSGPSDFNNPKGPPFPPGMYAVKIRAIGQHAGQPFEVIGELPITLTP